MELAELQKHWKAWGETDPFWAILSQTGKRHGGWDPAEFFSVGEGQIRGLLEDIAARGITVKPGKALDFGCGVGRLTQALANHFEECTGVDISPTMVERARAFNRHGDRCKYVVNDRDDLSLFDDNTFDLIYSIIVLQHMRSEYALKYIGEFIRVLAPGGLAVFQVPDSEIPPDESGQSDHGQRTSTAAPLPPSAFQAKLTVVERPNTVKVGAPFAVHIRVKNLSDMSWPALGMPGHRFQVHLANHWLDANRSTVMHDDARMGLAHDVSPGEELDFLLNLCAPSQPGSYHLEFDMVQEQVAWFKDRGSETVTIALDVQPKANDGEDFTPQIEMHHIKQEDVVRLVESRGGKVLDIQRVNAEGCLLDFNYYVTKL